MDHARHMPMAGGMTNDHMPMSDNDAEAHLMDLLADMDDDEIEQLAAIAEEMHASGGPM